MKEGKVGRKDGQPLPGEDEPLHAFVTGNSNESVKKAVNKVSILSDYFINTGLLVNKVIILSILE